VYLKDASQKVAQDNYGKQNNFLLKNGKAEEEKKLTCI